MMGLAYGLGGLFPVFRGIILIPLQQIGLVLGGEFFSYVKLARVLLPLGLSVQA